MRKPLTKEQVRKKIYSKKRYHDKQVIGTGIGMSIGTIIGGFPFGTIGGAGLGFLKTLETKKSKQKMFEKELKKQRKLAERLRRIGK